ncbi:MAG: FKBP-type peptidyl-prolyl cis-trans isomerase [Bacteroidaceae bacterium]|nr:FKBP-type peptidyl-prolyl cis-trans isomerase [Bacteroidaceae bacterium]
MKKILLFIFLSSLFLASCQEETKDAEEFANWQKVNETAFNAKYSAAIANSSDNLDTIRCYSMTAKPLPTTTDYIVVQKLNRINELVKADSPKGSPIYTDSVAISYRGRLQPSYSYSNGMVFDQSFTSADYNYQTAKARRFLTSSVVSGFSTALQHMSVGDHWIVYIPHQLGYGSTQSSSSTIPAYSLLTFEIVLEKYW